MNRERQARAVDKSGSRLHRGLIIALMAVGGLGIWIANPVFWMWVTSRLETSTQPSMGPYGLLLLGIVLTAVAIAKGLAMLSAYYQRVSGTTPTMVVILPWRRSLRGGRSRRRETDGRMPVRILDVIMVGSVLIAIVSLGAWLVITNPTPPNIGGPGPAKH